jgi:hypothetical protein
VPPSKQAAVRLLQPGAPVEETQQINTSFECVPRAAARRVAAPAGGRWWSTGGLGRSALKQSTHVLLKPCTLQILGYFGPVPLGLRLPRPANLWTRPCQPIHTIQVSWESTTTVKSDNQMVNICVCNARNTETGAPGEEKVSRARVNHPTQSSHRAALSRAKAQEPHRHAPHLHEPWNTCRRGGAVSHYPNSWSRCVSASQGAVSPHASRHQP